MEWVDAFRQISEVVIDAYYVTDEHGKILEYNRAFFGLFPRKAARKLKGMPASDAMPCPWSATWPRNAWTLGATCGWTRST